MFSKNARTVFLCLFAFIIGAVTSYIACQYEYFEIITEISLLDVVVSSLGLLIGFYIAVVLEKQKSQSQNFYTYVENKFDSLWQDFISLNGNLDHNSNIDISSLSAAFKSIDQKIGPLKKIFSASGYDVTCISNIETKIDDLEVYLNSQSAMHNIINLDQIRTDLTDRLDKINETFANSYRALNSLS